MKQSMSSAVAHTYTKVNWKKHREEQLLYTFIDGANFTGTIHLNSKNYIMIILKKL